MRRLILAAAILAVAGCAPEADPVATIRPLVGATPAPTTRPTTAPATEAPAEAPAEAYYENCAAARAAGVAPLRRGDPGYRAGLDRDDDGVACE